MVRRCDEPIEVRHPLTGAEQDVGPCEGVPMQYVWRGRLWTVREVHARWRETGAWWRQDSVVDLLAEQEVWRVHATSGLYGASAVAELARTAEGGWLLRAVLD